MTVDRIELHNSTPDSPLAMIGLGLRRPDTSPPAATLHLFAPDGSHAHFNVVDPQEIEEYAPGEELLFTAVPANGKQGTPVSGERAEPSAPPAEPIQLGGKAG
jgi:hypothetical protein